MTASDIEAHSIRAGRVVANYVVADEVTVYKDELSFDVDDSRVGELNFFNSVRDIYA